MAKKYDIIERLRSKNERPFIVVGEGATFEVNTSKTTALHFMAIEKDETLNEFEKMDKMIEVALGKKAFNQIEKMDLSMGAYEVLFEAVTAALSGEDLEQVKERFQESE